MALSPKLHANISRLETPPKDLSETADWRFGENEESLDSLVAGEADAQAQKGSLHAIAYAVPLDPTFVASMSLSSGHVYLPPPPPRSPGSAGSGSFPHRRLPEHPPSITTTLGGIGPGYQGPGGSPLPYSPSATLTTPLSPYATVPSPLHQSSSTTNSPMVVRPPTGSTMVAEYNPQQWGRSGQNGGQFRPFNQPLNIAVSRALDENGGKIPL